jgi:hypothetical protein
MRKSKEFEVWRSAGSCRIRRLDSPNDLGALLPPDHADVMSTLQIQPELRAVAEIAAEPHRGIGGDRAAAIEDAGDAAGRNADIQRQTVGAELSRDQFALQQSFAYFVRYPSPPVTASRWAKPTTERILRLTPVRSRRRRW